MILYQGLLSSVASWARVGRGYVSALLEMGVDVEAVRARGFRYDPSFVLPAGLTLISAEEARRRPAPEVGLGFLHPPHLSRLRGSWKVNQFVWEADRCPSTWVQAMGEGADRILVPSRINREALVESGLPAGRIAVVPYGFDESRVRHARDRRPARSAARPFTFLNVAAPHWRKGVRELLFAYRRAFSRQDAVLLRIKTSYDPGLARKRLSFEIPSWDHLRAECGMNEADAPPLELDMTMLTDDAMGDLHAAADVYVSPSWGEGFGLAILDSLAAGVPVVATGWGGHLDYFSPGPDRIPFRLQEAGTAIYEAVPGARLAIPDVEPLAARLRWHYEHADDSARVGEEARQRVAAMTWRNAARLLLGSLEP